MNKGRYYKLGVFPYLEGTQYLDKPNRNKRGFFQVLERSQLELVDYVCSR